MTATAKPRPRSGEHAARHDRTARLLTAPAVPDTVLSIMLDMFTSTTSAGTPDAGPDFDEEPARAPDIALILDERTCPCGARAHPPHLVCRKCRDRDRWERRAAGAARRAARRQIGGVR
jgi:hypothetical protein